MGTGNATSHDNATCHSGAFVVNPAFTATGQLQWPVDTGRLVHAISLARQVVVPQPEYRGTDRGSEPVQDAASPTRTKPAVQQDGSPFNMATHTGPDTHRATDNRRALCKAIHMPYSRLCTVSQVHGNRVVVIDDVDAHRAADHQADAMITHLSDTPLMLFAADCALVVIYDTANAVVGVAHAGWQGTAAEIVIHTVDRMCRVYGSSPLNMVAGVSPCASRCCYQVDKRVYDACRWQWRDQVFTDDGEGRWLFDVASANRRLLCDAGLPAEGVVTSGICTICDDRFYSHRREGAGAVGPQSAYRDTVRGSEPLQDIASSTQSKPAMSAGRFALVAAVRGHVPTRHSRSGRGMVVYAC